MSTLTIAKKPVETYNGAINPSKYRVLDTIHASDIPMYNKKFITGLDKYSPSILKISNDKEREKEIDKRVKIRKELESRLGVSLDQDTPDGREFFSNYVIYFSDLDELDESNPSDKLLMYILSENYDDISFPVGKDKNSYYESSHKDYHITNVNQDLNEVVSSKRLVIKAKALLNEMYDNDVKKMTNVAYACLPPKELWSFNDTPDKVFDTLDKHLNNELNKSAQISHKSILEEFLRIVNLPKTELDYLVTIEKAIRLNILRTNSKGYYYNAANPSITIGTRDEVFDYYKQTVNQEEYGLGKNTDAVYSIKYQLNQKENLK